jgi:hypothetical protein
MKRRSIFERGPLGLAAFLAIVAVTACGSSRASFTQPRPTDPGPVATFADGTDGWTVVEVAGDVESPRRSATGEEVREAEWQAEGGRRGDGYLGVSGGSDKARFFDAPETFRGDQAAFVGGELRFSLRAAGDGEPSGKGYVIIIGSNGSVLLHELDPPGSEWTTYAVPLQHQMFVDAESNSSPEPRQFADVLHEVEAVRISAHWSDDPEAVIGLDDVSLRR